MYITWDFNHGQSDWVATGIYTNKTDAEAQKAEVITHHDTMSEVIERLLRARLGELADSLLRLEKLVGGTDGR